MRKTFFLTAVVLLFLAGPARAQFFIEQAKVNLAVSGGERVQNSVVINNMTPEEVSVRVYWEDFEYEPPFDGAKKFYPAGASSRSASGWVQYVPQEFRLPAYGKQKVDYTITVPRGIDGGHYGVLFFEKTEDPAKGPLGVKIVTRIGCLFFIEPKNKVKQADIRDVAVNASAMTGSLANEGNVVLIARTTYYIMDEGGMAVDRGEMAKFYIGPQSTASWKIPLPADLKTGRYTLFLNSDLEEGDVAVKEITFEKGSAGEIAVVKVQD